MKRSDVPISPCKVAGTFIAEKQQSCSGRLPLRHRTWSSFLGLKESFNMTWEKQGEAPLPTWSLDIRFA